jgi:hypothetical protein
MQLVSEYLMRHDLIAFGLLAVLALGSLALLGAINQRLSEPILKSAWWRETFGK